MLKDVLSQLLWHHCCHIRPSQHHLSPLDSCHGLPNIHFSLLHVLGKTALRSVNLLMSQLCSVPPVASHGSQSPHSRRQSPAWPLRLLPPPQLILLLRRALLASPWGGRWTHPTGFALFLLLEILFCRINANTHTALWPLLKNYK